LQDVALSVGIAIGSSFIPDVQWYYNDQPIADDENYDIITNATSGSSLFILNAVPSDTGTYRVVVNSSVGSNSASFRVNINGQLLHNMHKVNGCNRF